MYKQIMKKSAVIVILVIALLTLTVSMAAAAGGNYHRVQYGETLYSISYYYGVNPHHLARINHLANPNYIYAGQVLYIPVDGGYDGRGGYDGCYQNNCNGGYNHGANYHIVRYGETLSSIAYFYGISPWAIARANHLYNLNCIYAGQRLYIPR